MPNKVKLSPEEKVKAVQGYLSGALSMSDFEQQYNLSRQSLNVYTKDEVLRARYQQATAANMLQR